MRTPFARVVPSGWYQTVPANNGGRTVNVVSGQTVSPFAFGTTKYGSISGVVFRDSNRNGKRDTGKAGLQGWTAYIDANNNGKFDSGERTTTTNSSGAFTFGNLKAGFVTVRVMQKSGFSRTTPAAAITSTRSSAARSSRPTCSASVNGCARRSSPVFPAGTDAGETPLR